jgi:XTP/dITP diphosphohydrolase
LTEIRDIWKNLHEIEIDWLGNYPELEEIEENGSTLYDNSLIKASFVSKALGVPAVADDTGFFVEYLGGAPGVYSSRYSGKNASYEDNVRKLLHELEGIPRDLRKAEFRCVVCFFRKGMKEIFTEGAIGGFVTEEKRGESGFGYDPVFEIDETGRTFAEMSLEEKNSISHRFMAFQKMGKEIRTLFT